MRNLASWLLQSPWQATVVIVGPVLLILALPLLSPLFFISGAALALVTLRQGIQQGIRLLFIATVISGSISLLVFNSVMPIVWIALLFWLPLLVLAQILRTTISLDTTVKLLAVIGCLAVSIFYIIFDQPLVWLSIDNLEASQSLPPDSGIEYAAVEQLLEILEVITPSLIITSLLILLLAALLLARWWQALLFNPGGFRKEFHELRLGKALSVVMTVLLGIVLINGLQLPLLANMTIVMSMIYLVQGISLAHGIIAKLGLSTTWLVAFYVLIIFAISQLLLLVLAVIDAWADFRNRVKTLPGNTH